jgi:hypothetical protein
MVIKEDKDRRSIISKGCISKELRNQYDGENKVDWLSIYRDKIQTLERVYEEDIFLKRVYLVNNEYIIKTNPFQTFILLYQIRKNWLQKEENIRYLINILFLIIGVCISLKH